VLDASELRVRALVAVARALEARVELLDLARDALRLGALAADGGVACRRPGRNARSDESRDDYRRLTLTNPDNDLRPSLATGAPGRDGASQVREASKPPGRPQPDNLRKSAAITARDSQNVAGAGPHKVTGFPVFLWYGPALVSTGRTRAAARIAGAAAALVLAGVSAAGAAGPGDALRRQAAALDARAHRALLDLYALDTRLASARTRVAALEARAARLRREQLALAQQLFATHRTLARSQDALANNLALLYKQGDVSALAVVLGSESLDDAVTRLDDLNRAADERRQVAEAAADAQVQLESLRATLHEKQATLASALAAARTTTATLAGARAERSRFLSGLRTKQRLNAAAIDALEQAAARVERKSDELQAEAAPPGAAEAEAAAAPQPVTRSTRTITVWYSLAGHTSTGLPVGPGVVAVDPAVIPLGTRMTIPGYGEGVAADTGSAVSGYTIDLWFPTLADALAWGRRTITIMLH